MMNPQAELRSWLRDPVYHITTGQGAVLEDHQKRIVRAVEEHDRVVVTACHGIGKTFTMSRIVLWFTSVFARSKVITTAPTGRQVRLLLWSEIRNGFAHSKIKLGGNMLTTEWKIAEDWFAVGVASKHEAGSETHGSGFQGFHAPHVLLVFDEGQGVGQDIWRQAEGIMTSANVKMVAIGNPLARGSAFYQATQDPGWHWVKLTCFDSINLRINGFVDKESLIKEIHTLREMDEDDRNNRVDNYKISRPHLLTAQWVVKLALKNGVSHPLFLTKALGEFPESDENVLIPLDVVEKAQNREAEIDKEAKSHFGVDVARFGSDATVITEIRGDHVMPKIVMVKKDNVEVSGRLCNLLKACLNPGSVSIDATGVGSGVVDALRQARDAGAIKDVKINEVHFGAGCEKDREKARFVNLKSKMFQDLADELNNNLLLCDDPVYQEELPNIRFRLDSKGRIQIESKDDYKARTGLTSPDSADSLALAVYGKLQYNRRVDVSYDFSGLSLGQTSKWKT